MGLHWEHQRPIPAGKYAVVFLDTQSEIGWATGKHPDQTMGSKLGMSIVLTESELQDYLTAFPDGAKQ